MSFQPGRTDRSSGGPRRSPRDRAHRLRRFGFHALPRASALSRRSGRLLRSSHAYATVLGLWLIFFGQGVVDAVRFLSGDWEVGPALTWGEAVSRSAGDLASIAAAIWLVTLLAGRLQLTHEALGWRPTLPARRGYRTQAVVVAFLYLLALALSALIADMLRGWFGGVTFPHRPSSTAGILAAVTQSLSAGILEELVLVATLVTILEAARQPVWLIYALGVTLRWSFHVYYAGMWGPGLMSTLWVLGWAAAAIALFRWTRRLTPLIVVHVAWDLVGNLAYLAGDDWAPVIAEATMVAVAVAMLVWRSSQRRKDRRLAQTRIHATIVDLAVRMGVPAPQVILVGRHLPQIYRGRHGRTVLRYDASAAIRHTDDQMTGLIAHELQHLAFHDPLPRSFAYRIRDVVDRTAAAAAVVAVGIVFSSWVGFELGLEKLAAGCGAVFVLILVVRCVDEVLEHHRLRRSSDVRWDRELAADRRAAQSVGAGPMRAAIRAAGTTRAFRDQRARPLPPMSTRLAGLESLGPAPD